MAPTTTGGKRGAGEGPNPFADFLGAVARGTLSASEVRELRPKMQEALLHTSDNFDEFLSRTNAQHAQAQIWSTIDEDDARTLTDALLLLGQKSAPVAGVVRLVADSYLGVRALMILGPRFYQTAVWYPAHGGFSL